MQKLSEPEHGLEPDPPPTPAARRGLPPPAALMAILFVALGGLLLLRLTSTNSPPTEREAVSAANSAPLPNAVQIFEGLRSDLDRAFDERDPSLVEQIYTPDSPVADSVRSNIAQLKEDNIRDRGRIEIQSIQVVSTSVGEIELREVVHYYPCFRNDIGRDVTRAPGILEQRSLHVLHQANGEWRIHTSRLEDERVISRLPNQCTG
jgi:hypothetical protein